MSVYIIGLGFSTLFCYLSKSIKVGENKSANRFVRVLMSLISVVIPCLIAACRADRIGTDVAAYGNGIFISASYSTSLEEFLKNHFTSVEPLFRIYAFMLTRFHNRYVYYFGLNLACVLPVYVRLNKDYKQSSWVGLLTYYIWLYGFSLNIMRQSIAISILFYASKYIYDHNLKKYIIFLALAVGFHSTAIIGILPYIMFIVSTYDPNKKGSSISRFIKKYQIVLQFMYFVIVSIVVLYSSILIQQVSQLTGKFEYESINAQQGLNAGAGFAILTGLTVLLLFYIIKNSGNSMETQFLPFLMLCGVMLFYTPAMRVSLYFTSCLVSYVPFVYVNTRKKNSAKLVFAIISVIACVFIYHYYVVLRWNAIYPYEAF